MKVNFDYYKQDVVYSTGDEEEKILECIINNNLEQYEEILEKDSSYQMILALSTIRNNIINAYDFKENSNVLEIGAHYGEVTNLLCEKLKKVVAIETVQKRAEAIQKRCEQQGNLELILGNFEDIKIKEKFDYITLIGILEYAPLFFKTDTPAKDLINWCVQYLKDDGKILIATNNKFALKSFVGDIDECTNNTFDSITGYKSNRNTYKLGKKELENILMENGLKKYKFMYPLPDYKLPNIIFSDDYLPSSSKINGYFPYYRDDSSIFFSEVDCYDSIIKQDKNLFKFFANSFLIEASKDEELNDAKYISFNNYRKKKYRLMTKIRNEIVEKSSTNIKSIDHIKNIKNNIESIKSDGIKIIDFYEDGKIKSKYIKDKLVSQKIGDNLENKEYIFNCFDEYKNRLDKISVEYKEDEETIFEKFGVNIEKEVLRKFKYLTNGYWDMIFKNCFFIDNQFVFFDQEWAEKNVPVEFIIYRCIVNVEKLRTKIEEYNIFERMGISEYIDIFKQLDNSLSEKILDKKIFDLYTRKHSNPIYDIGKLRNELMQERNKSKELEKSISNLSNEIFERDREIANERQELNLKQQELNQRNEEISIKDEEIKKLKQEMAGIYDSRSWKIIKGISKIIKRKRIT